MHTRSQTRNLHNQQHQAPPPVVEQFNLEEPIENPAPPLAPMDDTRTMAQLLEAPTAGYEDAIIVPEITADNFELKHGLLNLVQNKQFFGHDKEDPHAHIRYFNKITSTMKFLNVPSTSVKLMLFLFSLEGAARIWLEKEPPRSIQTWDDLVSKFINKFFPPSKTTNLRNEITRFQQRFDETFYEAWDRFNDLLRACPHHGFSELHQLDTFYNALNSNDQDSLNSAAEHFHPGIFSEGAGVERMVERLYSIAKKYQSHAPTPIKVVEESCVTCGGYLIGYEGERAEPNQVLQIKVKTCKIQLNNLATSNQRLESMLGNFIKMNTASTSGTLPSNTVTNPKEDLKGITTRSGVAYKGPTIHTTSSPKVVEREPEVTKDMMPPTNNGSTEDIPPPVVPIVHHESISEPVNALVSASRPNQKASIPFPSRRNDERRREKANDQIEKFYEIFRDLSFEISFTDALMLMPKFASTLKTLIGNKEKLSEMARTPLNENCSAVILNKLPKKLGPWPNFSTLIFSFSKIEDDPTSPEVDPTYYDPDGDILLLEAILNSDPSPPPPNQGNYFPETRKDLKICEANSSVNEPPEKECEEKAALIEVLKSHKRAIAWKLSDIKGINPEFCTHKILMEEDYEPTVQHQRRVNPKIHDVIKKEVEKLLDAGLIYPISDSPWVSPVHCVPKKGGMTVVKNDENDLIPTRWSKGGGSYASTIES
ncbi:reverse transcriptase domain-containing protein [Tanacetum coccineum]|uniref:Reverse transcriptase domain-containing protein n=1 Tax=Tanacetum coccineum TaxID=301880 RepID=A0ABQ5G9I1_9ASTR